MTAHVEGSASGYGFATGFLPKWLMAPETLRDRVEHTLDAHADSPDDRVILTATSGIYVDSRTGAPVRTGITFGDLREMLTILDTLH